MIWFGVPILDWVLLILLLGLGVEAYITTRPSIKARKAPTDETPTEPQDPPPPRN